MITTQPQQESTFLQDLQTGLDEFQAENKLQADLLLDWDQLQRTPRWASHKPTHLLIAVALVTTIRNRITGYKPSATEICQILVVLTMYTDRESAQEFDAHNNISSDDIKAWVEQSQVIPWLHDLESRCIAQGRKFLVWSAQGGSIQDKIQTRAWG